MASSSVVLLSLALFAVALAAPVDPETTTVANEDVELVEDLEVIDLVPVVAVFENGPTETTAAAATTTQATHKVAKRDTLRGDNPSNDLLAGFEGIKYENGLSSLEGRRIKFLPTWVG